MLGIINNYIPYYFDTAKSADSDISVEIFDFDNYINMFPQED